MHGSSPAGSSLPVTESRTNRVVSRGHSSRDIEATAAQDRRVATRPPDRLALAVLAALTALVTLNRLAFDTWLTRLDLYTFFLPWYTQLGERLRALDVPAWNPHLFSGTPFAGDPESGWMYVPAMVAFTFMATPLAFKAMIAIQLAVAAISTYAFARVLGMGSLAALIAATIYVTGPFLQWNTYCCLIFSQFATWIPLALLGVELSQRVQRWPARAASWFVSALAISQMFAGWGGEGWLYAGLLPASYIGYRTLLSPPLPTSRLTDRVVNCAITGITTLGLGLALGAAGVLPRLAINSETNLAGGNYSNMGAEGVLNPPWSLDYLLVQILGTGTGYHYRAAAFGGVAIVLSLLAIPLARQRYAVPYFVGLTLVAVILPLETTPLHQLFYLIPHYREFHDHDAWRSISLSAIGPAMLSGATVASLPRWRGRRELLPVVIIPLLLLSILALILARVEAFLGWQVLIAAALTTALVALVLVLPNTKEARTARSGHGPTAAPRRPRHDALTLISVLVLVVAFLFPAGWEVTGSWLDWPRDEVRETRWKANPAAMQALATEVRATDPTGAGAFLQQQLTTSGPFRYAGYGGIGIDGEPKRLGSYMDYRFDAAIQSILVNGRPLYLDLYDIQGYDPLQLARYVEFMDALNGTSQDYHTANLLSTGLRSPLLDLLDVRYLLLDTSLPPERSDVVALTTGRREVFRTDRVAVYESIPTPRHAWIVHDVRLVARGEALPLLTQGTIDPYRTALVEGDLPQVQVPASPTDETAVVTRYEPDTITIAARAAASGLLVVSDVYERGWHATIDGEEVTPLPTDHALIGVPLPAGEHTIELHYEPAALKIGVAISGISALAMVAVFAAAAASLVNRRRGFPARP